ncbi:monovalent cation/H(+) antiporter subunit G [Actinomadura monticuli]|uniref:Monovalent cation/H(+) antiporter subunit G n=1 Tax=Actinomadura monticuli TaxID=3097367 RepID=A0ABV4QC27_9ACTN
MSPAQLAAQVLLWAGVAAQLACCAGVWWMRDVFDRLHYTAGAATVGPALIGTSVVLTGGAGAVSGTVEVVAATAVLLLLGPVVTHALGRAARRALHGDIGEGDIGEKADP